MNSDFVFLRQRVLSDPAWDRYNRGKIERAMSAFEHVSCQDDRAVVPIAEELYLRHSYDHALQWLARADTSRLDPGDINNWRGRCHEAKLKESLRADHKLRGFPKYAPGQKADLDAAIAYFEVSDVPRKAFPLAVHRFKAKYSRAFPNCRAWLRCQILCNEAARLDYLATLEKTSGLFRDGNDDDLLPDIAFMVAISCDAETRAAAKKKLVDPYIRQVSLTGQPSLERQRKKRLKYIQRWAKRYASPVD